MRLRIKYGGLPDRCVPIWPKHSESANTETPLLPNYQIVKRSDSEAEAAETQTWLDFALACKYLSRETYDVLYPNTTTSLANS